MNHDLISLFFSGFHVIPISDSENEKGFPEDQNNESGGKGRLSASTEEGCITDSGESEKCCLKKKNYMGHFTSPGLDSSVEGTVTIVNQ